MKDLQKLEIENAERLNKAMRENKVEQNLPVTGFIPVQVYAHKDQTDVKYSPMTLKSALEVFSKYAPIECEHWKAACVTVAPVELNRTEKNESATLDGVSVAEILMHSFGNPNEHWYKECSLVFWAKQNTEYLKIDIPVKFMDSKYPEHVIVTKTGNIKSRDKSRCSIIPKFIGEDQRRSWWSEKPHYRFSYYWADIHNFNSAMQNLLAELEPKPYQPKTGAKCSCKKGIQRDNCPNCEGTGMVIDFAAIRNRK